MPLQRVPALGFEHLLDCLLEGCQILDFGFRYLYVNDAASQQARQSRDRLVGRTMMEAYPGIERTAMFRTLTESMNDRVPRRLLNEFSYPDGSHGWFELSIHPVPEGVLVMSLDVTTHKRAEEELRRQMRRLDALRAIDLAILQTTNWRLALKTVRDEAHEQLNVDAVAIALLNGHHRLEVVSSLGLDAVVRTPNLPLGSGLAGTAARERRTISKADIPHRRADSTDQKLIVAESGTAYATPLVTRGELIGLMVVSSRACLHPSAEWVAFLEALAGQGAMAIDSGRSFDELQRSNLNLAMAYEATMEGWCRALELRDRETEGHTVRVTDVTVDLARAAGVPETQLVHVRHGALLHDIGKMGVPDAVLLKPGPLDEEEWRVMRQHPTIAHELMLPIAYLRPALDIPYCHHERWNGSGYPRGLSTTDIPLEARLFAVVDVWDALRSDRPYRKAWPESEVRAYLQTHAGDEFDTEAVALFRDVIAGQSAAAGLVD